MNIRMIDHTPVDMEIAGWVATYGDTSVIVGSGMDAEWATDHAVRHGFVRQALRWHPVRKRDWYNTVSKCRANQNELDNLMAAGLNPREAVWQLLNDEAGK